MRYHDAHCHLQADALERHLAEIIEVYRQLPIGWVLVNGTCESDWDRVAALAEKYAFVRPAFGLHPWKVNDASEQWESRLLSFLDRFPNASIGEIGLDRWVQNHDIEKQEACFRAQLDIAVERGLPVSVHCLQAWGKTLEALGDDAYRSLVFLLHSYGGSEEMIVDFEKLGGYFSISAYFSLGKKAKQREVFKSIPIDRLLIETDAPDMAGDSEYSKYTLSGYDELNNPGNIVGVYRFVADLLDLDEEELAETVDRNLRRFLG